MNDARIWKGHEVNDHSIDVSQSRAITSPNRLKLGIFGLNMSGGMSGITTGEGPPTLGSWDETRRVAQTADRLGVEAMVSVTRWRGFNGVSGFWDRQWETSTFCAGLAAATERMQLFTTVLIPAVHPVTAAKVIATIDHISGGRAAINVVAGWFAREFELFGLPVLEHSDRYRYATEWIEVVKRLWTEDEKFDFDGEFVQVKGAVSEPKPVQRPYPMVMNAGLSAASQQFTGAHADMIFVGLALGDDPAAKVASIKQQARDRGREIQVWATTHVTCRDTEEEAQRVRRYYADEHGDWDTAREFVSESLAQSQAARDQLQSAGWRENEIVRTTVSTAGLHPIIGSPERVVEQLAEISGWGIDGVTMSFYDYDEGLERFERQMLPLMWEAGLRSQDDVTHSPLQTGALPLRRTA